MDEIVQPIAIHRARLNGLPARPGAGVSDDQLMDVWQLLRRTMTEVESRLAAAPKGEDHSQSAAYYEALARLAFAPKRSLPMTELAAAVGLTSGGLTRLIDRLVKDGLVERAYSTTDRRMIYAVLTDKGAAHERRSTPMYIRQLRRDLGGLGPAGLRAVTTVCLQLRTEYAEPRAIGRDEAAGRRNGGGRG